MADNAETEFNESDFMEGLDINDDVQELEILEAGEYELEIKSVKPKTGVGPKGKWAAYSVGLTVVGVDSEMIFHMCWLPLAGQDQARKDGASRDLKAFCEAFGLGWPAPLPFIQDEMQGLTGWARLRVAEQDGKQRNEVVTWVRPNTDVEEA